MSSETPPPAGEGNEQQAPSQSTISRGSLLGSRRGMNLKGLPTTQLQDWFTTLQDTGTSNPALEVRTDVSPSVDLETARPSPLTPARIDDIGPLGLIASAGASNMASGCSMPRHLSSRMENTQIVQDGTQRVEDTTGTDSVERESEITSPKSQPIAISPGPTVSEREESVVVAYAPLQETVGFFSRLAAQNLDSLAGRMGTTSSSKMEDFKSEPLPRREVVFQHGFPYPGRSRLDSPTYDECDELRQNLDFFDSKPLNPPSIDYSKMPITSPVLPVQGNSTELDLDPTLPPQPTVPTKLDWGVWTNPINYPRETLVESSENRGQSPEEQPRLPSYLAWHRHTSSDQASDIAKEFRDGGHRREPMISEQTQAANAVTNPSYPLSSRQRQGTSNSDQESFMSPEIIHNINNSIYSTHSQRSSSSQAPTSGSDSDPSSPEVMLNPLPGMPIQGARPKDSLKKETAADGLEPRGRSVTRRVEPEAGAPVEEVRGRSRAPQRRGRERERSKSR